MNDTYNILIEQDLSEIRFEVPQEFEEVLNQDYEAKEVYDNLSAESIRSKVYLVKQVKKSQKRINRSILITNNLKVGITNANLIMTKS